MKGEEIFPEADQHPEQGICEEDSWQGQERQKEGAGKADPDPGAGHFRDLDDQAIEDIADHEADLGQDIE